MAKIKIPSSVLKPLSKFLKKEEVKLSKQKKEIEKEDPFNDPDRLTDNTADADAAEEFGHSRVSALKQEIDKALVVVRKTLTKIKLGKYGLCEDCGHLINTDRLAVNPTAELCIKCAQKKEKKS